MIEKQRKLQNPPKNPTRNREDRFCYVKVPDFRDLIKITICKFICFFFNVKIEKILILKVC